MNVFVLNCGSSSLRFQFVETDVDMMASDKDRCLAQGLVERIGGHALITTRLGNGEKMVDDAPLRDHRDAMDHIARWARSQESGIDTVTSAGDIHAVGHRVVHGGEFFRESVKIDDEVLRRIEDCVELAPLHNPANLKGIRAIRDLMGPGLPEVAVFDTAFHTTMPEASYLYGVPYQYYRRFKVRRYGFHGTSHRYVAYRYRKLRDIRPNEVNIITLHLGNGCSACAIKQGKSFDTSMGFTPLEGLLMGTRSGDIDPSLIEYLVHKEGMSLTQIQSLLNKQSGLLGISGLSGDMRDLLAEEAETGDRRARLAIDVFCHRVKKIIGAYVAAMGGADAVVFAGGIGENSPDIRARICKDLNWLGVELDESRNAAAVNGECGPISVDGARLPAWVVPTNEELMIARDTACVMSGQPCTG